jgi:hypothetical protein
VQNVGAAGSLDWRMLANGHLDELLYERNQIDTSMPLADLRARNNITEKAKAADDSPDFSARIRQGLPETRERRAPRRSIDPRKVIRAEENLFPLDSILLWISSVPVVR